MPEVSVQGRSLCIAISSGVHAGVCPDTERLVGCRRRTRQEGEPRRRACQCRHGVPSPKRCQAQTAINSDTVSASPMQAKAEGRQMERANRAASEAAYKHFNAGRQDDAVDLHGLYVKEALERARAAIRQAKAQVGPSVNPHPSSGGLQNGAHFPC